MSTYETHELHRKEALRTHWYQGSYAQMKEVIFKVADEMGMNVIDVNDTYQEFLLDGDYDLVIKVCSYGRYEQGVDFNLTTRIFFDFGQGKRLVTEWYRRLGTYLKFKGISLHP